MSLTKARESWNAIENLKGKKEGAHRFTEEIYQQVTKMESMDYASLDILLVTYISTFLYDQLQNTTKNPF